MRLEVSLSLWNVTTPAWSTSPPVLVQALVTASTWMTFSTSGRNAGNDSNWVRTDGLTHRV